MQRYLGQINTVLLNQVLENIDTMIAGIQDISDTEREKLRVVAESVVKGPIRRQTKRISGIARSLEEVNKHLAK